MWDSYHAKMLRFFPRGTIIKPRAGGGVEIEIACCHGHTVTETFDVRMPPEKAKKHLQNKGWYLWGKRTRCPEHEKPPQPKEKKDDKPMEIKPEVVQAIAANDQKTSSDARVAKRQAMLWLDEVFDDNAGRYKEGHSDETVGKEVGLSASAIGKLREEFGFEIKEPAEIAAFRKRLTALEERAKSMQSDAAKLATGILQEADDIRARLSELVKRNGW